MRVLASVIAAAALAALALPAAAQQPTQAQANAIKQACRSDYQAHCASVPTGGSASLQCLQQNAASLSAPCQNALSAVSGGGGAPPKAPPAAAQAPAAPAPMHAPPPLSPREEMALLRGACGGDYRAFCQGVRPGGGRAAQCLRANGQRLSPRCRTALYSVR